MQKLCRKNFSDFEVKNIPVNLYSDFLLLMQVFSEQRMSVIIRRHGREIEAALRFLLLGR